MKYSLLLLPSLLGLSCAVALPQDIDIDAVEAAPSPTNTAPPSNVLNEKYQYNPAAARESVAADIAENGPDKRRKVKEKRDVNDPCAKQPDGYGPLPAGADTAPSFLSDAYLASYATNASTPDGYTLSFQGLQGSTNQPGYSGLTTFNAYDQYKCASLCDAHPSCSSFNLYIERDPSVNPAAACPNPPSITNFKCTLWQFANSNSTATNTGQSRGPQDANGVSFTVAITASNGYVKNAPPPSQSGFDGPTELGGAINAPNSYMGMKFFPGNYDPGLCASACTQTTAYDRRHARSDGTYDACNFFNSYVLSKNGVPQGTYCGMYTKSWDKSYSTNYGQYRGSDRYTVSQSYAYTLDPQDPGQIS